MQERENTIHRNDVVEQKLEAILSPWATVAKEELPDLIEEISVPVIELARRSGVSPQQALREAPSHVELNGQNFKVMRGSKSNHNDRDEDSKNSSGNIRIKKLIRESVKEPAIKGVRNGGMSLDEKVLKRKIGQAHIERERLIFQATESFDKDDTKKQRRKIIHDRIADRFLKKSESLSIDDNIAVNESDESLKILRSLVHVSRDDIRHIAQNTLDDPSIHLFDFFEMLGLSPNILEQINENHELLNKVSPQDRLKRIKILEGVIDNTPTLHPLSKERIHPLTSLEEGVPLFFGMGGGSRMPCQGLPLDVLKMVFTGEKLRRELGITKCFVLGADVITYTNIGRSPGFTKEKVDQVIGTEIALLNEVFRRFGFDNWEAIKQSEIARRFPHEDVSRWKQNIAEADSVPFVGGHHYAIEMADIQLLVPNGIKLGWWIRPLTRDTGYIMDEQPFHARFALVMALLGKPHATTLLYTHAGSRILLGEDGLLQKEAPYITYTPDRRLLLSPFENIKRKLEWAEKRGGGLAIPFVQKQMSTIVDLFEELTTKIPLQGRSANEVLANKLQFIVDQGVGNDSHLSQMWKDAFPKGI